MVNLNFYELVIITKARERYGYCKLPALPNMSKEDNRGFGSTNYKLTSVIIKFLTILFKNPKNVLRPRVKLPHLCRF